MLIDTMNAHIDMRLASWAAACCGGVGASLDFPGTNILHPKHGIAGKYNDFSEKDWEVEIIMRDIRRDTPVGALAIEHVYFRLHEEKRETHSFQIAFDAVKDRLKELLRGAK